MAGLRIANPALPGQLHPWRELAGLTRIGMELFWIALWYSNLTQINQPVSIVRAFVILGILILVSHFAARALNWEQRGAILHRGIDLVLMLLGLFLALELLLYAPAWQGPGDVARRIVSAFGERNTIPPEFWVLLACLLVWNRGIVLARSLVSADHCLTSFELGLLMFFLYGITLPFLPVRTVLGALFGFLVLGLVSMSAARIYETGRGRGGRLAGFNRVWLVGIALAALVVAGVGIVPASLIPPRVAQFAVQYLLLGLGLLAGLVVLILSPVVILILIGVQAVMPYLVRLLSLIQLSQLIAALQRIGKSSGPGGLIGRISISKPVALWGTLILVAVIILAGLSWRAWRERSTEREEGMMTASAPDLLRLLRAYLGLRFNRARDLIGRASLRRAEQLFAAARVRWIYARLMRLCARRDHPRPPAKTPLEFLPDLEELFPGRGDALREITQAYVRVRYGEAPETREEVEQLMADWKRIEN
jgi:hypothetical protein